MDGKMKFPEILQKLHTLEFDYLDGEGMDFEPYKEFLPKQDTQEWLAAWTGNRQADASPFLIFGQDGTGGYAAIWCIRPNADVLSQPVAFFGSEGEIGIVAPNFSDYLWLLAAGYGPYEAISYLNDGRLPSPDFTRFAESHAWTIQRSASDIVRAAKDEFPHFESEIEALCR